MKKILLTMIVLMAMTFSASATEPTYTAWGYSSSLPEWESTYSQLTTGLVNLQVEVYGNDSIIIRNWFGAGKNSTGDTYDLVCVLTDGHITSFYTSVGGVSYPYYGNYVYPGPTGFTDPSGFSSYVAYLTHYTTGYEDFTQYTSNADTKTGEMILYGTLYSTDNKSKAGYYHLTWSPDKTSAINSVTTKDNEENAPMYNLAGQRVSKNAKGLVIKNGKKMILK